MITLADGRGKDRFSNQEPTSIEGQLHSLPPSQQKTVCSFSLAVGHEEGG